MDIKSNNFNKNDFPQLFSHCHVNTNIGDDVFVGVKADSEKASVYFPLGYNLPLEEKELRKDIKNLIKVLKEFTTKEQRVLSLKKISKSRDVEFPISAYIDVIEYYISIGCKYYVEDDISFKKGNSGKISWKKTIQSKLPLVQNNNGLNSLIFTDFIVKTKHVNENKLITQINKYCVAEAFRKIGWLYNLTEPKNYNLNLDPNISVSILRKKLQNSCNDKKNTLFQAMINMILYIGEIKSNSFLYYGVDNFEYVWEKMIDKAFGIINKRDYFPKALWSLYDGSHHDTHVLRPDTIMLNQNKNHEVYILDAKYYKYGVTADNKDLPDSSSINKQITYGEYVECKLGINSNNIFNVFIMPYNMYSNKFNSFNSKVIDIIGEATCSWKANPYSYKSKNYEVVLGVVLDIRYLMYNYSSNSDVLKSSLISLIKKRFGFKDTVSLYKLEDSGINEDYEIVADNTPKYS